MARAAAGTAAPGADRRRFGTAEEFTLPPPRDEDLGVEKARRRPANVSRLDG